MKFTLYRYHAGSWRVLSEHFDLDAARELVAFAMIARLTIRIEVK